MTEESKMCHQVFQGLQAVNNQCNPSLHNYVSMTSRKTHDLTGKASRWLLRCPWLWKNVMINILTILVVLTRAPPCNERLGEDAPLRRDRQVHELPLSAPPLPKLLPNTSTSLCSAWHHFQFSPLMKSLHVKLHRYAKHHLFKVLLGLQGTLVIPM